MSERSDFNDMALEAGDVAVAATVSEAIAKAKSPAAPASADASTDNWPDPILPGQNPTPDIPAALLPTWVAKMAEAVAASTQTPEAMATMTALAVLATALHRRFEVAPWGEDDEYTEPLCLWTLTALPSGSRKTAVLNAFTKPLVHWEKLERDRLRTEIARIKSARAVAKKRIEKLTKDAVAADSDEAREKIRKQIQDEEEAMPAELRAPRLFTGDVTAERLQALIAEHGERMAVISDEGGQFNIMAGIYNGGAANIDVYLQSHAGTPMRVDRAERSAHIDKPALSVGLAIQPGVLAEVASNRRFRDSGLLARFLYAIPKSNVGERNVRLRSAVPSYVRNEYETRINDLLDGRGQVLCNPRIIGMDDEAREVWLHFCEEVEGQQGERGALESIVDWSSKLPGAAARVAGLIELARNGLAAQSVGKESVTNAVSLCRLLIPHAQAAFGMIGGDAVDTDVAAIIQWARDTRNRSFSKRDCQKAMEGRFRTVARLDKAVERLTQTDAARVEKVPKKGAPPTTMIRLNPKLFVDFV